MLFTFINSKVNYFQYAKTFIMVMMALQIHVVAEHDDSDESGLQPTPTSSRRWLKV